MPLYKTITVNPTTKVYIWKVTEDLDALAYADNKGELHKIALTQNSIDRLSKMKSALHRRGFMSIRHLLLEAGYTDLDLFYDALGKPHLTDEKYISITHSYHFTAIIVSTHAVGIDIEKQRDKILRIAHKFTPIEEYYTLNSTEARVRKLTIVWGAKESLYKISERPGLSFLKHIDIDDFDFDSFQTTGEVVYDGEAAHFNLNFLEFEGFTCVYAQIAHQ